MIAYPVMILAGFNWLAISVAALNDAINSHWRMAALIGIAALAVIIFGIHWLQTTSAKRMIARVCGQSGRGGESPGSPAGDASSRLR